MLAIFNSDGVKTIMECNWYLLFLFDYLVIQKLSLSETCLLAGAFTATAMGLFVLEGGRVELL